MERRILMPGFFSFYINIYQVRDLLKPEVILEITEPAKNVPNDWCICVYQQVQCTTMHHDIVIISISLHSIKTPVVSHDVHVIGHMICTQHNTEHVLMNYIVPGRHTFNNKLMRSWERVKIKRNQTNRKLFKKTHLQLMSSAENQATII